MGFNDLKMLFRTIVLGTLLALGSPTAALFGRRPTPGGLGNVNVPHESGTATQFMLDFYRKLEAGTDLSHASGHRHMDASVLASNTVRGVPATEFINENGHISLTVNLTSLPPTEVTKKAELHVTSSGHHQHSQQFRIKAIVLQSEVKLLTFGYTVKSQRGSSSDSTILDLTPLFQEFNLDGHGDTILKLKVHPLNNDRNTRRNPRFAHHSDNKLDISHPVLVIFAKEGQFFKLLSEAHTNVRSTANPHHQVSRGKRSPKSGNGRQLCEKRDLHVDFDAIGWGDWIIHPKRYNAFVCTGRCQSPINSRYDPTNHAVLQSLLRIGDRSIPKPCCAPSKLKPLSMLYVENNEVVVRHHKNMIVDKCGCR